MGKTRELRGALWFAAKKAGSALPAFFCMSQDFNGSLAGVVGGGIGGVPGVPRGQLQAAGLLQGPVGLCGGDVHLGAQLAVVIDPFGVPAVQPDAAQRAGLAQAVVLLHLQVEIVVGPVGNRVEQVAALNLGAPLGPSVAHHLQPAVAGGGVIGAGGRSIAAGDQHRAHRRVVLARSGVLGEDD